MKAINLIVGLLLLNQFVQCQISFDSAILHSYLVQSIDSDPYRPINTGSGFFTEFEGKYYLISNLHVIASIDPETGDNLYANSAKAVGVSLLTKGNKRKRMFKELSNDNKLNYSVYKVKDEYLDISIVILDKKTILGNGLNVNPIPIKDIFETPAYHSGDSIVFVGFPNGTLIDGWKPTISVGIITKNNSESELYDYLMFDGKVLPGYSGSPIYKKENNQLRIIGILFAGKDTIGKGLGISIKFVSELILEIIKSKGQSVSIQK